MKLVCLRLSNFRSFGPTATELSFNDMTFLLGPNGTGKTAALRALMRMFSLNPAERKIRRQDFHVPPVELPGEAPELRHLWLEADFEFPELLEAAPESTEATAVPPYFAHMQLVSETGPVRVRFRLQASIDRDGDVEESLTYVIKEDEQGKPTETRRATRQDRATIQVHYLPARRDPADHISYSANAVLGRTLRSANWGAEREEVAALSEEIRRALTSNNAIKNVAAAVASQWGELHKGNYYANPSVSFGHSEHEGLIRHLTIAFEPAHDEPHVDFTRLSDGQQSLLYISIVLAMHEVGEKVLGGSSAQAFHIDKLRPPVFTLVAIEEPENSLSPHYLGRVLKALGTFAETANAQAVVATHSPSLLRRVAPEAVRYLRLDANRMTAVKLVELPEDESAQKFIREGVQAFPELYFSRLVVLGEGDSEEIVIPRLMSACGLLADDASISVVPLGGRHVNHLWRLLHGLGIPHVTLLDLDEARNQGGWGRIKYAARQLRQHAALFRNELAEDEIDAIPKWNSAESVFIDVRGWVSRLEEFGVFFSTPLDLDFTMMRAYPAAYDVDSNALNAPGEQTLKAVLGPKHAVVEGRYSEEEQSYLENYHRKFKLGSKPTAHIQAMSRLDDDELVASMPPVLERMFDRIGIELRDLPE